jgi:hypothetical protein
MHVYVPVLADLEKRTNNSNESISDQHKLIYANRHVPNSSLRWLALLVHLLLEARSRGYKRVREGRVPKSLWLVLLRVLHIGCSLLTKSLSILVLCCVAPSVIGPSLPFYRLRRGLVTSGFS